MHNDLPWEKFGEEAWTARLFDAPTNWVYGISPYYSTEPRWTIRLNGMELGRAADADAAKKRALDHFKRKFAEWNQVNLDSVRVDASDYIKEYLLGVVGIVEANSFESSMLWEKHHEKREWKETLSGYLPCVGFIGERPIHISLMTAIIDGFKILFWHPTSQVVDHALIVEWFQKNLPTSAINDRGYPNSVDAQNFFNVFDNPAHRSIGKRYV